MMITSTQVREAINALWDHNNPEIKGQALAFIQQLRTEPSAYSVCLPLFTQSPLEPDHVRHFSLEIVAATIELLELDQQTLTMIKDTLMDYVQKSYANDAGTADGAHIQNKISQVLTNVFVQLYDKTWASCFDEFLQMARASLSSGAAATGTVFYFRFLGSVHDEIADTMINKSEEQAKRATFLRDLVRERDVAKIAAFWQEMLSRWREIDPALVEICLRSISRWVSWSDIAMVVNQPILQALLEMAGQQDVGEHGSDTAKLRDAALDAYTSIAAKKMRPADKIELIKVIDLQNVVNQLISSRSLQDLRNTPEYDADFAEAVAKLVNHIVRDLIIILDSPDAPSDTKQQAHTMLQAFLPALLRFFSDEYDEVCNTVIDAFTEFFTFLRRIAKDKNTSALVSEYAGVLPTLFEAVIRKMRYDETADWGEEGDDSEEAEFQVLRKRLSTLQTQVTFIDENLVVSTVGNLVLQTFQKYAADEQAMDWRDLELAMYQLWLFGDFAAKQINKGGRSAKNGPVAQKLNEMMTAMIGSKVGGCQFPAIQLQFADNCVRYYRFFENNNEGIKTALAAMVDYSHSPNARVNLAAWYNLQRFCKLLRTNLGEVSQSVLHAIADLLSINAVISTPGEKDESSSDSESEDGGHNDPVFNSQIYLFEVVGILSSAVSENAVYYLSSIANPIFEDMTRNMSSATAGDERAIMQIHHDIMALGAISHGFTDWMPGNKVGTPPPDPISDEIARWGEGILQILESLNSRQDIRQAAQNCLARLLGGMGNKILPQLPRWIDGLLSQTSTKSDTCTFLHLLTQIIFAFKTEISPVLDIMLSPLLQRVFTRLQEGPTGTDDEIQLAELRRKFLAFINIILQHELSAVLVSATNQTTFDHIITAITHFAGNPDDLTTARSAIALLTRLTSVFGGPDVLSNQAPAPLIPGFDAFVLSRFSPVSWALPATQRFKASEPQAKQVIYEIALMQSEILKKTGDAYARILEGELTEIGLAPEDRTIYVAQLRGGGKEWKEWLVNFFQRAG